MSAASSKDNKLVLGGPARVDLLPPEIKAAKGAAAVRRRLTLGLVGVIVVCALGYSVVTIGAVAAAGQLESERSETTRLIAEQGQYSEASTLAGRVAGITAALNTASSTEIDWASYIEALIRIAPTGTRVAVAVDSSSPVEAIAQPLLPLEKARTANVVITLESKSLSSSAEYLERLKALVGYEDASANSVSYDAEKGYVTVLTLHINKEALRNRFLEDTPGIEGVAAVLGKATVDAPEEETTDDGTTDGTDTGTETGTEDDATTDGTED